MGKEQGFRIPPGLGAVEGVQRDELGGFINNLLNRKLEK